LSWDEARAACARLGGDLWVVDDEAEQLAVSGPVIANDFRDYWIGLTDADAETTFVWIDGSDSTYTNWAGGEPNDAFANEDCVQMRVDGLWNDNDCAAGIGYICEVEACGGGTWYVDADGDGQGAGSPISGVCGEPAPGWSLVDTDCDDAEPRNGAGNAEVCDGVDNDCDGVTFVTVVPGPAGDLTDSARTTFTVDVLQDIQISGLDLGVSVTHASPAQVNVVLVSPAGTQVATGLTGGSLSAFDGESAKGTWSSARPA
jgi:hypothetical protein